MWIKFLAFGFDRFLPFFLSGSKFGIVTEENMFLTLFFFLNIWFYYTMSNFDEKLTKMNNKDKILQS